MNKLLTICKQFIVCHGADSGTPTRKPIRRRILSALCFAISSYPHIKANFIHPT